MFKSIEYDISIHALVKRATSTVQKALGHENISIHALVKRATWRRSLKLYGQMNFNPRPREEGDTLQSSRQSVIINFNPRPREEGDSTFGDFDAVYAIKFQSTPS